MGVATIVLAVVVALLQSSVAAGVLRGLMVLALVPCAVIDIERRIIPNRITYPGTVAGVAVCAIVAPGDLPAHLIAGAAAGVFLLIPALMYPRGMGMGDVKLVAMMGVYLGREVAVAILVGLLAGAVIGAVIMARVGVREGRKTGVPFGPFLALGGIVAIFAGPAIVDWYLNSFA